MTSTMSTIDEAHRFPDPKGGLRNPGRHKAGDHRFADIESAGRQQSTQGFMTPMSTPNH